MEYQQRAKVTIHAIVHNKATEIHNSLGLLRVAPFVIICQPDSLPVTADERGNKKGNVW